MKPLRDVVTPREARALGRDDRGWAVAVDDNGIAYGYEPLYRMVGPGCRYKTIRAALRVSLPGDVIALAPGHNESVRRGGAIK